MDTNEVFRDNSKKSGQLGAAKRAVNSLCSGRSDMGGWGHDPPQFFGRSGILSQLGVELEGADYAHHMTMYPRIFKPS